MEEPKKVLRAQYLGTTQVSQATGMEVLNEAIDRLVSTVPPEQWQCVNVAVAPSMISIQNPNDDRLIAECRVRYLSFLGIGKVIKHCAFVMHTAQDTFVAHVFYCEPSSGALCKTIEAACKVSGRSGRGGLFSREGLVAVEISEMFRCSSPRFRKE
jgi:amyloid beta (A4) precursor protein-binding family B protein 2 (Fe65-like)